MSQYNESEKILLLHQYVTSGLTLHEFSSRHGIPLSTFHRIYTEYGSPCTLSNKSAQLQM